MSKESDTKNLTLFIKDLALKSEQFVMDLIRYLAEALPQIELTRDSNEVNIKTPKNLSKRTIKLRIKKYLYKKGLNNDFRPISLNNTGVDGYAIKEKRLVEITYY